TRISVALTRHLPPASSPSPYPTLFRSTLENGETCLPAKLHPLGEGRSLISIREGKYHQVRRMMAARGMPVTYLKRVAFGGLTLGELPLGAVKEVQLEAVQSPPCDIAQAGSRCFFP